MPAVRNDDCTLHRIEEYKMIRAEVHDFYKSRGPTLTIAVSAMGVLLSFAKAENATPTIMAIFTVLVAGAILTWSATMHAQRRASYLLAFIESDIAGFEWYRALFEAKRVAPGVSSLLSRLRVSVDVVPQEYPLVYSLLGIVGLVYAIHLASSAGKTAPVLTAIIGLNDRARTRGAL